MNYLKTIGFAVLFAISFGISSTAAEKSIRIAFMGAQTDEDMHGSLVFKDYVEATSNGKIGVEI